MHNGAIGFDKQSVSFVHASLYQLLPLRCDGKCCYVGLETGDLMKSKQDIDKFSSEYTPPESERLELLQEVNAEEAQITQIIAQISALSTSLEARKEQLQRKRLLADPIRRVPPELLGFIFEHCCEK